ncbi:hypothetical protein B0T17DRAFT_580313 [Bombardia bombarda]|uniref:Uncharacterized protein n=1 Tax=Bombardia bombarda TaxID=252184 RepID=A0AA40BY51_9PEZI|nr:hypothetical protein B0T17DRAFT_580313 [Bombardia bombarda]
MPPPSTDYVSTSTGPGSQARTGPDYSVDSWYRGTRQPPLAVRLDNVINFLCDEDVDRCINWENKFGEVVLYLNWLAHEDGEKKQLLHASPQTQTKFRDAVDKAKTHVLFENHHRNPYPPFDVYAKPSKLPLKPTRLKWAGNAHNWPMPGRGPPPLQRDLIPRSVYPRAPQPANPMLAEYPKGASSLQALGADERAWWADQDGVPTTSEDRDAEESNLANIESESFVRFSDQNSEEKLMGWVQRDAETGLTLLSDGSCILPDNPAHWARERGARRAGLQQMLRAYPTSINSTAASHWRGGLALPVPAKTLLRAQRKAAGVYWTPVAATGKNIPAEHEVEPMPYTLAYKFHAGELRRHRVAAALAVDSLYRQQEQESLGVGYAILSRNMINAGPVVWRMVISQVEEAQDLLRKCRTALKVLRTGMLREPREVLGVTLDLAERGLKGEFENHWPVGVRLEEEEQEEEQEEEEDERQGVGLDKPKMVSGDELWWLRFLGAGEAVNEGNWMRGFDVPGVDEDDEAEGLGVNDRYRLFLRFADRVQRELDDRNPGGLFASHDAAVTVEELLEKVNAGAGGNDNGLEKARFMPFDACAWLDRMHRSGHVRFELDPAVYGVVRRPAARYFPENRVKWPQPPSRENRPVAFSQKYVASWPDVISTVKGRGLKTGKTIDKSAPVWHFFIALGFRLGTTILKLERALAGFERERHQRQWPIEMERRRMQRSLDKWREECDTLEDAYNVPTLPELALALIRTKVIEEVSENKTMLYPCRKRVYYSQKEYKEKTVVVRDYSWDWASAAVRERKLKQFWSVNRWPLESDYLSDEARNAIVSDGRLDPMQTYDPAALDPTDQRWMRPKLQRFAEEKVKFRPGPALYPIGDTRLQRYTIEEELTNLVNRSLIPGKDDNRKRTWRETLTRVIPRFGPSPTEPTDEEVDAEWRRRRGLPWLPDVDFVPTSWDPVAVQEEAERKRKEAERKKEEVERKKKEAARNYDVEMIGA